MTLDPRALGSNIRIHRELIGYKRSDLAEMCGVTRVSINLYETGKRTPSLDVLVKIAQALGVPTSKLIDSHEGGVASDADMRRALIQVAEYLGKRPSSRDLALSVKVLQAIFE